LRNIRDALTDTSVKEKSIAPLLEANHTSDTRTVLYGLPRIPVRNNQYDHVFMTATTKNMPDLIFLQMDPMPFIVR